jgi:hypothetical protein
LREVLAIARRLGDVRMEGTQLTLLGWVGWLLGDGARAEPLLKQGLDLARKAQNPDDIGLALRVLGEIERSRGRRGQAIHYFQESLGPLGRTHPDEDVAHVQELLRQLYRR